MVKCPYCFSPMIKLSVFEPDAINPVYPIQDADGDLWICLEKTCVKGKLNAGFIEQKRDL